MNEDRRNFVLFAVIAALILFGWPYLQNYFLPTARPPVTRVEDGKSVPLPQPGADPTADSPAAVRDRAQVLRESPRVRIATPTLSGSINLVGARVDDLVLTRHRETIAANSPPIRLLSPAGTRDAYFAAWTWRGQGLTPPPLDARWTASAPVLAPGGPVTLTTQGPDGRRYLIEYRVDDGYMFTVRQTVVNNGPRPVSASAFGLVNRQAPATNTDTWTIHVGPMSVHDGQAHYEPNFDELAEEGPRRFTSTGGWLGYSDLYWLTALIPDQGRAFDGQFRPGPNKAFQADFTAAPVAVRPGAAVTQTTRFFAGAKDTRLLDRYTDREGVARLDYAIDWGWFRVIEKPIFYYLDWLFRLVGNFGVAIILLTVTFRLLVFPIAQRQFQSAAAMRRLQPKMKALQDRFKDDKVRMQQEVMQLYKTEKVNPLAGCLPTLLQIPIFYALYKVLMLTIEMRHQPFVGWIKDLSAPDPLTPVNLFGLLPFTAPAYIGIGVVPILLGVSMYFQFKLNPQPMDETQQQVFKFMPWVLMFVMAPFAVGLQVYWITSNLLGILQQRILYARHPEMTAAPAK